MSKEMSKEEHRKRKEDGKRKPETRNECGPLHLYGCILRLPKPASPVPRPFPLLCFCFVLAVSPNAFLTVVDQYPTITQSLMTVRASKPRPSEPGWLTPFANFFPRIAEDHGLAFEDLEALRAGSDKMSTFRSAHPCQHAQAGAHAKAETKARERERKSGGGGNQNWGLGRKEKWRRGKREGEGDRETMNKKRES